ncbi:hypothetical protein [Streptomyces zaomyceticus]|uniref:hypothetical protein n=1 Tax=Streptomyces zaomyceticus TaxID=68286 RepID=UPI0037A8965B
MTQPTPEILVEATRYTVSLLPRYDINFNAFALHVQRRRDGWGITGGHGWVEGHAGWMTLDSYEALVFPELDDALALARKIAPTIGVNGHTATDAYNRRMAEAARS